MGFLGNTVPHSPALRKRNLPACMKNSGITFYFHRFGPKSLKSAFGNSCTHTSWFLITNNSLWDPTQHLTYWPSKLWFQSDLSLSSSHIYSLCIILFYNKAGIVQWDSYLSGIMWSIDTIITNQHWEAAHFRHLCHNFYSPPQCSPFYDLVTLPGQGLSQMHFVSELKVG